LASGTDGIAVRKLMTQLEFMDISSIASAFIGAQAGQAQLAVAAKILKMNADQEASVAKLLEAAQANFNQLANVAAGIGTTLDITV